MPISKHNVFPYPIPKKVGVLPIAYYGNPCLRKRSQEVDVIDEDLKRFGKCMLETMYQAEGIGLAAPQVGVNLRIVTIDIPYSKQDAEQFSPGDHVLYRRMPLILINPVLSNPSSSTEIREEGCLSLPGLSGEVERYTHIVVSFLNLDGERETYETSGLLARCLQHEIDHLDGILYIDRMDPQKRQLLHSQLKALEKETLLSIRK